LKQAVELLATTGIPSPGARAELSAPAQRRPAPARHDCHGPGQRPRLLLADEPTTALDVTLRGQILDLLADLQRQTGMAVLMITHDLNLVRRFADRVAVMEKGRLVEQGAVADLMQNPQHAYTRKLLASRPVRNVVEGEPAGEAAVVQTRALQVSYATPLPGIRGWFKKGIRGGQGRGYAAAAGRTLGVIGESGSGKSTLAQAVLGLLPAAGELQVAGRPGSSRQSATAPPIWRCGARSRWCFRIRFPRCRRA
jgi:microcin C transport system ATP-binding protein